MITFTKEQLIASAHARIEFAEMMLAGELEPLKERTWSIELELARIALASLEAEAVCVIDQSNLDYLKSGADADVWPASRTEMGDVLLYRTAPPAPANAEPVAWLWSHRKHPSEVTLVRPEDDEMAEGSGWSGWSCQALYAAQPAPVSVPDIATVETTYPDVQTNWQDAKMYAEGWNACRAAMLQGAEQQNRQQNIPENIPFEQWLSQQTGTIDVECGCVMTEVFFHWLRVAYEAGNYPVIPDGWVLVPEEPTHEMLEAGDEQFGTYDVYRRMIAAAPQQEVKP
ncbi:MAG: hypothetical protein E7H67_21840 [Enterobacter asburiae]|nr:hypothetical protein [Enterobacter asburiae]